MSSWRFGFRFIFHSKLVLCRFQPLIFKSVWSYGHFKKWAQVEKRNWTQYTWAAPWSQQDPTSLGPKHKSSWSASQEGPELTRLWFQAGDSRDSRFFFSKISTSFVFNARISRKLWLSGPPRSGDSECAWEFWSSTRFTQTLPKMKSNLSFFSESCHQAPSVCLTLTQQRTSVTTCWFRRWSNRN